MKRYIIKETAVATADNPNFAGEVQIAYFGKGEEWIAREGTHLPNENFDHSAYMLAGYGYKRLCDAKRSYAYKHPENSRFWEATSEIIEVEC